MTQYVIRRILWGILLLIVVCALTFVFLPKELAIRNSQWRLHAA